MEDYGSCIIMGTVFIHISSVFLFCCRGSVSNLYSPNSSLSGTLSSERSWSSSLTSMSSTHSSLTLPVKSRYGPRYSLHWLLVNLLRQDEYCAWRSLSPLDFNIHLCHLLFFSWLLTVWFLLWFFAYLMVPAFLCSVPCFFMDLMPVSCECQSFLYDFKRHFKSSAFSFSHHFHPNRFSMHPFPLGLIFTSGMFSTWLIFVVVFLILTFLHAWIWPAI